MDKFCEMLGKVAAVVFLVPTLVLIVIFPYLALWFLLRWLSGSN